MALHSHTGAEKVALKKKATKTKVRKKKRSLGKIVKR